MHEQNSRRQLSNVSLLSSLEAEVPEGVFAADPEDPPASRRSYRLPPVPRLSSLRLQELLPEDERREAVRLRSSGAQSMSSTGHHWLRRRAREEQRDSSDDNLELLLGDLDEDKENKPVDYHEFAETNQRVKGEVASYGDDYEADDRVSGAAMNPLEKLEAAKRIRRLEKGRRYAAEKRRAMSAQRSAEDEAKRRAREAVLSNLKQLQEHARKLARTPLPDSVEKRLRRERSERRQLFEPPEMNQPPPETVVSKVSTRQPPYDSAPIVAVPDAKKVDGKRKLSAVVAPAKPAVKRPTPGVKALPTYQQFKSQAKPQGTVNLNSLEPIPYPTII